MLVQYGTGPGDLVDMDNHSVHEAPSSARAPSFGSADHYDYGVKLDETEKPSSSIKYHMLGIVQLVLKMYSLGIVLLIVTLFELKRTVVSVLNHLALVITSLLSTCLFILVLFHQMILSLRENIHYLLHLEDSSTTSCTKFPSRVKYSELHSLFWSSDKSHKIRISDDFQSFEIIPTNNINLSYAKKRLNSDSTVVADPLAVDVCNEPQGINLSFISSPGISKVQQFNNKYKEKLKKRPHWWKVGTSPISIPEGHASEDREQSQESLDNDEEIHHGSDPGSPLEVMKSSDFENQKFVLASSPLDLNETEYQSHSQQQQSPIKLSPSNSSKFHSKFKVAMESNRQNVIQNYAKSLKTFKNHHISTNLHHSLQDSN
ncbi:unnamed protein product [Wickerhamomyces anomalus]